MANKKNANYINKPFMLNKDILEERELYEWLQTLPTGEFKQETKKYWIKKMKEEDKMRGNKKKEVLVKEGDTVRIVGHRYFVGGTILPIGSEFVVEKVIPLHNAIEYKFGDLPWMNWWIVPGDYEIIKRSN